MKQKSKIKTKKVQKKPEVQTQDSDQDDQIAIDPSFSFEFSGGDPLPKVASNWNFESIKRKRKSHRPLNSSSLDQKIDRIRKKDISSIDNDDESISEDESIIDDDSIHGQQNQERDDLDENDIETILEDEDDEDDLELDNHQAKSDSEDDSEDVIREKKHAEFFADPVPKETFDEVDTFTDMRLSRPILKGVASLGFVKPTPIQSCAIPLAMKGKDICGAAITGSGKTAAFVIPILERLLFRPKNIATTRVLVLVPTRELGAQCHSVAVNLAKFTDIQFSLLVGGLSSKVQEAELRKRPDVIIATPGRLIDHIHNTPSFNLDSVEILVMDEADRMLDDGFKAELNEIIRNCPKGRQTMLFSATMTDNVDDLIKLSLNRPTKLFVNSATSLTNRLTQEFIRVRSQKEQHKGAILTALCSRTYKSECIVFFRSKNDAHDMKLKFGLLGLKSAELHGNLSQVERLEALERFRDRKVDFLLATDLASRGLDIAGIKTVVNFDMPTNYNLYVHRVGRTARAGQAGRAVSLVQESDRKVLKLAIKNAGKESSIKNRVIPSKIIERYCEKLEGLKDQIAQVSREEKEERVFNKTEMELNKASNMISFSSDIRNRPKREWFQSQEENAKSKGLGVRNHEETSDKKQGQKRSALDGLSRKKKRIRSMMMEEEKDAQKSQNFSARSAKKNEKQKKIPFIADKSSKPNVGQKKKAGKKKGGGMFDSEKTNKRK